MQLFCIFLLVSYVGAFHRGFNHFKTHKISLPRHNIGTFCIPEDDGKVVDSSADQGMNNAADKSSERNLIFGLDLSDPQDWVTVVLGGIVIYQGLDLFVFFVSKLRGTS